MADLTKFSAGMKRLKSRFENADPVYTARYVQSEGGNIHTVDVLNPDGSIGPRLQVRGRVLPYPGALVRLSVDRKRWGPDELVIMSLDDNSYTSGTAPTLVEPHGANHGFNGPDQIPNLHTWQIYPLRVQPYSGLTVRVLPGIYVANNEYRQLLVAQDVDLSAYVAALGAGAQQYLTLSADEDGNINVAESGEFFVPTAENIPTVPAGEYGIGAIRIVDGDTAFPASRFAADLRYIGAWTSIIFTDATRTVGAGGEHITIQDAIDWFKYKIVAGDCTIAVDAGAYDETLDFSDILIAPGATLTLQGDTRVLAGLSYVDGADCNQAGLTNGGDGVVTLSSAGTDITVAMATTNPDFDADGWDADDTILVYDDAGTITEETVASVANNVITLTGAAPNVGNDGTAICLLPNRSIRRTAAGPCVTVDAVRGVVLDGWYLETDTGASCDGVRVNDGGFITCQNTAVMAEDFGFYSNADYGLLDIGSGACSAWDCTRGVYSSVSPQIVAMYSVLVGGAYGFFANAFASIVAQYSIAVNITNQAYRAGRMAYISANYATARQNGTGYYANERGYILASNTNAQNNGNGTDYNPAVSDTFGNSNGSITWS